MNRKEISGTEYQNILDALVSKRLYTGAMAIVSGRHKAYGRVILIRSGYGFAIIADHVSAVLH